MISTYTIGLVTLLAVNAPIAGQTYLELDHRDGLPGHNVNAISELADGTVVFGTTHGLAFWRDGEITRTLTGPYYDASPQRRLVWGNSDLPSIWISALAATKGGVLWIGMWGGLARFEQGSLVDVTDDLPRTWSPDDPREQIPINGRPDSWMEIGPSQRHDITALFEDSAGRLLIGTRNAGLIVHDPVANSYELVHRIPDSNKWITAFDETEDGAVWVAVFSHGILRYEGTEVTLLPEPEKWVPATEARALCVDSTGALWVGTHHGVGLRRPDGSTRVFSDDDALPSNHIWHLAADDQGRVWVMTSAGPAVWEDEKWVYPVMPERRSRHCWFSYEGSDGHRWISDGDGVVRFGKTRWNTERPSIKEVIDAKARIQDTYPHCETGDTTGIDAAGRVWTMIDYRLLVYDGRMWTDKSDLLADRRRLQFVRHDHSGRILVGTSGEGFLILDDDEVTRHNNRPEHAMSVTYDMAESPDGTIYLGTQYGLYQLVDDTLERLLDGYQVSPLVVDHAGKVWFGDPNTGLLIYDRGQTTVVSHNTELEGYYITDLTVMPEGVVRVEAVRPSAEGLAVAVFDCDGERVMRVRED